MIITGNISRRRGLSHGLILFLLVIGLGVIGCSDSGDDNPVDPTDGGNGGNEGNGGDEDDDLLKARWSGDDGIGRLLETTCLSCHGGSGGFYVSPWERAITRVIPGDPDNSLIIKRLEGTIQPRMPRNGPPYLSDAEIDSIRQWIAGGALNN